MHAHSEVGAATLCGDLVSAHLAGFSFVYKSQVNARGYNQFCDHGWKGFQKLLFAGRAGIPARRRGQEWPRSLREFVYKSQGVDLGDPK